MVSSLATSSLRGPVVPVAPAEGAIARFLIAPLTFISFLISLALIDNVNITTRVASHQPSTRFPKIRGFFRHMLYKESPYAYVRNPDGGITKVEDSEWHWHNNQRKMMRMEVVQAFDMRKWVLVGLVLGTLGAGVVVGWGARLVVEEAKRRFW